MVKSIICVVVEEDDVLLELVEVLVEVVVLDEVDEVVVEDEELVVVDEDDEVVVEDEVLVLVVVAPG